MFPYHADSSALVHTSADRVFGYLDDHRKLSSHMGRSSWMMAGAKMAIEVDTGQGQQVGSRIALRGRVLGVRLWVEEVVTERLPPQRKTWETVGSPKLLVIGHYRMGFELQPVDGECRVRVFIDYALPERGVARWLGRWFGRAYANWCTRQMVEDAARQFGSVT